MATKQSKPKFVADPAISKANLADAMEKLKAGITSVVTPAGLVRHLTFASRGNLGRYSFRNQILIQVQRPGAFHVGGYHYWIGKGRRPLAGRGCRILAPSLYKKVREEENEETGELEMAEQVFRSYRTVVVWDIRDTNDPHGLPYDGPTYEPVGSGGGVPQSSFLTTDDEDERAAGIDEALRQHMVAQGVAVTTERKMNAYGSYNHTHVALCVSPRHDPLTTCATVVHEAAHWQEFVQELRDGYSLGELVAEGVAFVVLQRYGLDTSSFSFKYIQSYGGDLQMFQRGLTAIQKIAQALTGAIEAEGLTVREEIAA